MGQGETMDSDSRDMTTRLPLRLMVGLSGGGEDAALVRAAHRLASRDGVRWCAVYVDKGREEPRRRLALERDFAQIQRLGGETRVLPGQQRARELADYARSQGVATLVVGGARPSGWRFWRRPLAEQLARLGGPYDLVVVAEARPRPRFRPRPRRLSWHRRDPLVATAATLVALVAALGLESWLELANLSLLFLGAVLVSAAMAGTAAAMLSAVLGFVTFNVLFTEPKLSLAMVEREQLLTVVFFLLAAVSVGQLAGRGRRRLVALRESRDQTYRLLQYVQALSVAMDTQGVRRVGLQSLEQWLRVPVAFLERQAGESGLRIAEALPGALRLPETALNAAAWSWQRGKSSGYGTETLSDPTWRLIPLLEQERRLGVVAIALGERGLAPEETALLNTMLSQFAMALERTRLVAELGATRLSEEHERLRSALLASVSHDLRTPLASIIGSASTLRELEAQLSTEDRHELLDGILSESERLNRYIQNLLDMTRLGHGTLKIERDWVTLDDLVAAALKRLANPLEGLKLVRDWPDDLPLLFVHPALIEQALVNVLDNAARFSPPGGRLGIAAGVDDDALVLRVTDQGPGIPPGERERVFDMFFTGGEGDRGRHGSGLGLAICRGMVGAHGGRIAALANPEGEGTCIEIRLPLEPTDEEAADGD